MIQEISPKDAFVLMQKKAVTVVDVRDAQSYYYGHIPDAIHVPMSNLAELQNIPQDKPIIVYCFVGQTSQRAIHIMIEAGYSPEKLLNLKGGIALWNTEELPVDIDVK